MPLFTKTIIALALAFLGAEAPVADVTAPKPDPFVVNQQPQVLDSTRNSSVFSQAGQVLGQAIFAGSQVTETVFDGNQVQPEQEKISESEIPAELLKYVCAGCKQEVDKH